ncbi:MAG: PDZ domain-containing protein, partial [Methanomicrobiales archaeon]|nr:PDZ domain-containing protein [Methanomicrobiales archaeon]
MKPLGMFIIVCSLFSIFFSCDNPVSENKPDLKKKQYYFAVNALNSYFIFRDRLPADLYAFNTPQELYESVNDPYTAFYSKEVALRILNYWMTTRVGGVGIRLDSVGIGYVIKDVFKDSPASAAGLLKGDTIVQIDGISIAGCAWDSMSAMIRGNIGEKVNLTLKRKNMQFTVQVIRGEFNSPSVFVDSLASNVSYIYLTEFLEQTNVDGGSAREFQDALQQTSWAEYTIFDLRSNGGGEIDQCIEIISEFVPSGTSVMEFTERGFNEYLSRFETNVTVYKTQRQGLALNRKFVLLSDTNTASASEILISCLKTNRPDIKVIGDHTYGKACGQVLL